MRTIAAMLLLTVLLPAAGCKWVTAPFHGGKGYSESFIRHVDSALKEQPLFGPNDRSFAFVPCFDRSSGTEGQCSVDNAPLLFFPGLEKIRTASRVSGDRAVVRSPDQQHVADVDGGVIQLDGKTEGASQFVGSPTFSPDSRRLAYVAEKGGTRVGNYIFNGTWFVVFDGEKLKSYDGIGEGSLVWSPDSRRLAFIALVGHKSFVVVDGKEGKRYEGLEHGQGIVFDSPNDLHYLADEHFAKDGKSYDIYLVEETIY